MKSTTAELQTRGYVTEEDITLAAGLSKVQLIEMLHSNNAVSRSAAACNLLAEDEHNTCHLLEQLVVEKCLYTKLAICDSLEQGNCATAIHMTKYLGEIGNNQYRTLPDKVSKKKSFPLPRDIIARSLGRMKIEVFPVLISVAEGKNILLIQEVLDSIGYMVFYNENLVTLNNLKPILSLIQNYTANPIILWKSLLCLSAFPLIESKQVLQKYADRTDVIGMEAQRSLSLLKSR